MSYIIELPVSLGEAIDKLTILDIKCDKITDDRKIDVQKEYDILHETLKEFIETYKELYLSMKKINLIIWNQMDVLRDGTTIDELYMKLCKECIDNNDIRFRIKNKINLISNSELKEQKSYKINRLLIELNCNVEHLHLFIKPIQYFSYIYDEIIIQSSNDISLINDTFYYDNTIKYNTGSIDLDIKLVFIFEKNTYDMTQIYDVMNINEQLLQTF